MPITKPRIYAQESHVADFRQQPTVVDGSEGDELPRHRDCYFMIFYNSGIESCPSVLSAVYNYNDLRSNGFK